MHAAPTEVRGPHRGRRAPRCSRSRHVESSHTSIHSSPSRKQLRRAQSGRRNLILDHAVDHQAAKRQRLCLNNLVSLAKEVRRGLATNQDMSHSAGAAWERVHNYFAALAGRCLSPSRSKTQHYKHVCATNCFWRIDGANLSLRGVRICLDLAREYTLHRNIRSAAQVQRCKTQL